MASTARCASSLHWPAATAAVAAAILLWGVGVEAVYFGHRLSGGFLLADAAIVSALETATVICLVMRSRGCACCYHCCCHQFERATQALDSYRRSVVYAMLTVPCFVQLDKYWLPAVPGCALILAALFYALKHFCNRRTPYDFGKMPTFVRFEEDPCCLSPELLPPAAPQVSAAPSTAAAEPQSLGSDLGSIYQPSCWPTVGSVKLDAGDTAAPAPPPRHRQKIFQPLKSV